MRKTLKHLISVIALSTLPLSGCANPLNDHSPINPGELRKRLDKDYAKSENKTSQPIPEDIRREILSYELSKLQGDYQESPRPGIERLILWGTEQYILANYISGEWPYDIMEKMKYLGEQIEIYASFYLGDLKGKIEPYPGNQGVVLKIGF